MSAWDEAYKKGEFAKTEPLPEVVEFAEMLKKDKLKRVLDLGCGRGRHAKYLASLGFVVSACDISEEALKAAKELCKDACEFKKCDMGNLAYGDSSFDAVISNNVLQHGRISEIRIAIAEISRVLRKGGLLLVTIASVAHDDCGKGTEIEKGTWIDNQQNKADGKVPHHYFSEEEMKKEFSGFSILKLWQQKRESDLGAGRVSASWAMIAKRA